MSGGDVPVRRARTSYGLLRQPSGASDSICPRNGLVALRWHQGDTEAVNGRQKTNTVDRTTRSRHRDQARPVPEHPVGGRTRNGRPVSR
jgi:hypothetical protein